MRGARRTSRYVAASASGQRRRWAFSALLGPTCANLRSITPDLVAQHGITPEEYQRILSILGREPNFTELGIFSVMWSEHCSYKSSRVHLKTLPDPGAVHPAGTGRERRGGGHRRRSRHGLQDGEPQPSLVHRAVPGRGDRRGGDHPGHLHHGRAADRAPGLPALRSAHRRPKSRFLAGGVVAGISGVRKRRGRADGGRASCSSPRPTPGIRW